MSNELSNAVKQSGSAMTIWGIVTLILGMVALSSPFITGAIVAQLVGFLLLAGGIARMVWAFGSGSFGQGVLTFAFGGLTLLCGIAILGHPLLALASITVILAIYFMVDGIFEILGAFHLKPETGWAILLIGGVVSLLLGLMIWRDFPSSAIWVTGVFVGIKLLFSGLAMMMIGSGLREQAAR